MPTINGLKMACEPCIRGHRSTKCNHANERLMVPVRKPGRPLSQCPHPQNQQCSCSSIGVVAAIPRKQQCKCGGSETSPTPPDAFPNHSHSSTIELSSPTKSTFRVEKSGRRKLSFDPVAFARMDVSRIDVNNVNIFGNPIKLQSPLVAYPARDLQQPLDYSIPYSNIHASYTQRPLQMPLSNPPAISAETIYANNDLPFQNGFKAVSEGPDMSLANLTNGIKVEEGDCCRPKQPENLETQPSAEKITNGGSCCAPKEPAKSQSVQVSEENAASKGSCCESKMPNQSHGLSRSNSDSDHSSHSSQDRKVASSLPIGVLTQSPSYDSSPGMNTPGMDTPGMTTSQIPPPLIPQYGVGYNTAPFTPYMPHVYTYPSTYGSFQNPLQLSAWKDSVQASSYATPPEAPGAMHPSAFSTTRDPSTLDTVHTCSCGNGCSCVGCAAHPYNKETQDYVRSAWSFENQSLNDMYASRPSTSNGFPQEASPPNQTTVSKSQNKDTIPSPTAHTPASNGSGEEQLSAADFFFVNYPMECAGDLQSCLCGDDCKCFGCQMHSLGPTHMDPIA